MSRNSRIEKLGITKLQAIKWIIAIILPVCIFFIPTTETFTQEMRLFFVLTGICILVMAFDLMEMLIPALALPLFYILSGLGTPAVVFKPWLGIVPVSYTHLDVYKRQSVYCSFRTVDTLLLCGFTYSGKYKFGRV